MSDNLYESDAPVVDGHERDLIERVSPEEPWSLIEEFAELERVSGSADERRAADYIAERLAANGISHEVHEPELYISTPERASVRTDDGWVSETAKTVSFSGSDAVSGDLVYVENDDEMDSIASMLSVDLSATSEDLEGKVVLSESIIPISAIEELKRRGASAFVGIHPHEREPHEGIVTPVWGGAPPLDEKDRIPDLPVANVSRTEGQTLIEKAREGATVSVETETETGWTMCPVVVADIEGGADPDRDEFVLLHGHYDSWHVGVTDNATGDAALLELARVFEEHADQLDRNVRVAWWPGHSTGRYAGSTWYVDEYAQDLVENCVAHVNVDSPGVADATVFDRAKWTSAVDSVAAGAIRDVAGMEAEEARVSRAGDYSFSNIGVPGLSLQSSIPADVRERRGYHPVGGSGGHADAWHLTTDTIEKADPDVLVRDVRVFAVAAARLATGDPVPLDVAATARKHRATVAEYDDASEFDLGPVVAELDRLAEAAAEVEQSPASAEGLVEVAQTLTRLNYTSDGRFEQDPAEARPPYPSLEPATGLADRSGDDRRFLEVQLRRSRNEVAAALREARQSLTD